jgi:hypothetical protein
MSLSTDHCLLRLFLPEGILDYFDIVDFRTNSSKGKIYTKTLTLYLEEKKLIPEEYSTHNIKASGFMPAREIEDYPIRDMLVTLNIKRRRWEIQVDGKNQKVSRDWNLVSKGTRMSEDYSSFLKEISRF